VVRDTYGVGKPLPLTNFKATFASDLKSIKYDGYKQMEDDLSLIEGRKYTDYAYKQCLKICYYL
jgi:hypothetical protein